MLTCHVCIFFVEVSFKVFGPFFIQIVSSYSVLRVLGIFCVTVLYHLCLSQILSPTLWLIFFYSWYYLSQSRIFFSFMKSSLLFLSWIVFLVLDPKIHHHYKVC